MNGTARMTQGRLTKDDFKYNEYGYIVSKTKSKQMCGGKNPLRKMGLLQKKKTKKNPKGTFGPLLKRNKSQKNIKKQKQKNK